MPCPNIFMNADVRNCYFEVEQNNNMIMKVGPLIITSAAFSGTNMQDQTDSLNYARFSSSVKEI